jgi:effector-binding domain-containing protein
MTGTTIGSAAVEVVTLDSRTVVGLRERVAPVGMAAFFRRAVEATTAELSRRGVAPDGPPTAVYRHDWGGEFDVTVGFPVRAAPATGDALVIEKLPAGRAARAEHVGPYETMGATYAMLSKWFGQRRYSPPDVMWQEYLVGPDAATESEFRTRVICPLG